MTDANIRSIEAGAGRPFRFSLVLEEERGSLLYWLGGKWAAGFGVAVVTVFAAMGGVAAALLDHPRIPREGFALASAGIGAAGVAMHLRPRRVLFQRRGGTWCWKERWSLAHPGWSPITEESPLRLEREFLSTVEGWTLYAGSVRIFSYLGDPSIGRSVSVAFERSGVPLRTVMKRSGE